MAGWVPTPELVRQELADLAHPKDPEPHTHDVVTGAGAREPTTSVAWDAAAPPPPPRRIDASVLPAVLLVTVGALVGALALWLLAWPRGQAVPTAEPGLLPATSSAAASTASGTASTSAASPEVVVVDVAGAVRHPGVIDLPSGSRVIDALDAVGGALPRADTAPLNLARVLQDGEQVLVPVRGKAATVPGGASPGTSTAVNLNTATVEQLDALPGIGPVLAQRILDWRTANGGFASIDQLLEVSGIGDATFADLEPLVQV